MFKKIFFITLILLSLNLSGCWGRIDIEDLAFVQIIGMDQSPKGIKLSVVLAVPVTMAGGGGGGEGGGKEGEAAIFESVEAKSVSEALKLLDNRLSRRVTLIHNQVIVFGEEFARQGIGTALEALTRLREFRHFNYLLVTEGSAADLLQNIKPALETNPARYLTELVRKTNSYEVVPKVRVQDFLVSYEPYFSNPVSPLVRPKQGKEKGKVELAGTAVWKEDRMVGRLGFDDSLAYLLLTGRLKRAEVDIPDPLDKKKDVSLLIDQELPPDIKAWIDDQGRAHFLIKAVIEGEVHETEGQENLATLHNINRLEEVLAAEIKRKMTSLIEKAQNQYNSDILGLGKEVKLLMLTTKAWRDYNWPDRFRGADIKVDVTAKIRRTGMTLESSRD